MDDSPDAKKPCKGILKTSSSFDKPGASYRKSAKFDELNVLQTYHPPDKDYGHMKIDEPKTPYYDPAHQDQLDANLLAEKLRIAANTQSPSFGVDELSSDDEIPETEEERGPRLEFERRRKKHYNEFEAVRLARKLIQEEFEEDDEDDHANENSSTSTNSKVEEVSVVKQDNSKSTKAITESTATTNSSTSPTKATASSMDLDSK